MTKYPTDATMFNRNTKGKGDGMNLKTFHRLNKIVVNEDEFRKITEWVKSNNFKSIDFPFNECFVIINNISYRRINFNADLGIYFKLQDNEMTVKQYDMKDFKEMLSAKIGEDFFTDGKMDIDAKIKSIEILGKEHLEKTAILAIASVFDIFQYMTNKPENVVQSKSSRTIKKPSIKKTSRNKKSNHVKIHANKYTFDLSRNPTNTNYERYTEAWTVRGHWRYYKESGKRVWINAYTKGKGEVEGKTYKV